ncbi:MAG TPA: hypothetical protein VMD59_13680, partial [Acidimicrobiales bacterium]|nr:hypothetical protein [Acidimicrobiales bacterium]
VPGVFLLDLLASRLSGTAQDSFSLVAGAPLVAITFVPCYAVLVALIVRGVGRLVRPGWHSGGSVPWAVWTCEQFLGNSRKLLFPLYSTIYTRWWLRLLGLRVGRRTELSTAIGLGPLVSLGSAAFVADDVVFNAGRSRGGWLQLEPITVGDGTFLGNGALVGGGTHLGGGSLVGVQTTPPRSCPAGTSWFGQPGLEFPRPASRADPSRTVEPPRRLVAARAAMEVLRILLPTTATAALGIAVLASIDGLAHEFGVIAAAALTVPVLLAAGALGALLTMLVKWGLIGRYRPGEHPLWSFFVWRDEIVNSCQEMLAGDWLLDLALGTPIVSWYLRLMGAKVGTDVWCDTLTITEFEMVSIGDGVAINRRSCIETHLFHDRVMRIGPIGLGAGVSIGPSTAVLPDTVLGEGCSVGGRSVVLRGEELPANTRWHGAPVVAQ